MKKGLLLILVPVLLVTLALSAFACSQPTPAPKPTTSAPTTTAAPKPTPSPTAKAEFTVKVAHWTALAGAQPYILKEFGDIITQRTNGRVVFQYYWGETLAKQQEMLESIVSGVADMGMPSQSYYVKYVPLFDIVSNLGYLYAPSRSVAMAAGDQLVKEFPVMTQALDKAGIKYLFETPTPAYELQSTGPINSLADFKGLKVRTYNPQLVKIFKTVESIPTTVSSAETYDALQKGVVNATVGSHEITLRNKTYEVTKYYTYIGLGSKPISNIIAMSGKLWNRLPPDIQGIIQKTIDEDMTRVQDKLWDEAFLEAQVVMDKSGMKYTDLTKEFQAKMTGVLVEFEEPWIKKMEAAGYPEARKMNERLKALMDEYTKKYGYQELTTKQTGRK